MALMTEGAQRYRDYLQSGQPSEVRHGSNRGSFQDSVVVMKTRAGLWHAVWQGETSVLGEFDGTKAEAVDWARERSSRCWVYSEEHDDLIRC
jgi:hypothetical protein